MWKSVIIHIGSHKTGSTSIQKTCFKKASELSQHGIFYPQEYTKWHGHHELAWAAGVWHPFSSNISIQEIAKSYNSCTNNHHTLLLSSEDFEFMSQNGIDQLKDNFPSEEYKIILYLRRPDEYLISDYQQNVKMYVSRYSHSIHHFFVRNNFMQRLDYLNICRKWANTFGADALEIFNYSVEKNLLVESFLSSINPNIDRTNISRENNSLSALGVSVCALVNRTLDLKRHEHCQLIRYLEKDRSQAEEYALVDGHYRSELLKSCEPMLSMLNKEFRFEISWDIENMLIEASCFKPVPDVAIAEKTSTALREIFYRSISIN